MNTAKEIVNAVVKGIEEKKGQHIVVADLSRIEGTIANYFVVCSGNSPTQVEAIAESVGDTVRDVLREKPAHVVGLERAQWVAIDFTDVIVHIFVPELREFYDLENLWQDADIEEVSPSPAPPQGRGEWLEG